MVMTEYGADTVAGLHQVLSLCLTFKTKSITPEIVYRVTGYRVKSLIG